MLNFATRTATRTAACVLTAGLALSTSPAWAGDLAQVVGADEDVAPQGEEKVIDTGHVDVGALLDGTESELMARDDAVLVSERVMQEDLLTSVNISRHEIDARDTKIGSEEITREIPNVGEDMLANLDEDGIIRIGAEVGPGDILVGKVTPKGETSETAEAKLLRAIFGNKSNDVRDTSLRVPHGSYGRVVDVVRFDRKDKGSDEKGNELPPGVNTLVRVYIAQRRKIQQGDKIAGRAQEDDSEPPLGLHRGGVHSIPLNCTPLHSTSFHSIPFHSTPFHSRETDTTHQWKKPLTKFNNPSC